MQIEIMPAEKKLPIDLLLNADPSIDMINKYLEQGETFIAKYNDSVAGALVLSKKTDSIIEIMNISVEEKYQNRGIGKKLIEFSIGHGLKNKAASLIIATGNSSLKQLMLYQKTGFRIKEIEPDYFTKNYNEIIIENGIQGRDRIILSLALT